MIDLCFAEGRTHRLSSVDFEGRRQDFRWLRILFLLTAAIGEGWCRFRLVKCQPDGDGIGLSFGVGSASVVSVMAS